MAMADGYAQATQKPVLVNLHTAAGTGNGMCNIMGAFQNKTPLIITAGQQHRAMLVNEPLLTNRDATTLPKPWVKWAFGRGPQSPIPLHDPPEFTRLVVCHSPSTAKEARQPERRAKIILIRDVLCEKLRGVPALEICDAVGCTRQRDNNLVIHHVDAKVAPRLCHFFLVFLRLAMHRSGRLVTSRPALATTIRLRNDRDDQFSP